MRQDSVFQIVTRIPFFSMTWLCFLNVGFILSVCCPCKMAVSSSWGYILLGSHPAEKVSQYYKQNIEIHWTRLAWLGIRCHPWIPWSWQAVGSVGWLKPVRSLVCFPQPNGWKLQCTVRGKWMWMLGVGEKLSILSALMKLVFKFFVTNPNSC